MKILYIHQYFLFPEDFGGTRSFDLAKSFVSKGYDVEVITSSGFIKSIDFKDKWTIIERDGIRVHILKLDYSNNLSYFKRSIVFLKFLWSASIKALSIKCDAVLATSTPLTIGIPALIKKWFSKTPYIFEVRDVWPEAVIAIGAIKNRFLQKILYQLEKTIYKYAYAVVPLSMDMQTSIVSRFPQLADKTNIVIPNISEIDRFANQQGFIDLQKELGFYPRFSILYAGTFGKVNGIDYVIKLAEKTLLLDPKLVYILIGEGAEKEFIINIARQKNLLNKNVFIFDSISKSELPKWYNSVSMGSSFVIDIKELWANSANKFFDTLAASKPVLINHKGWQADVIEKENLGYALPVDLTDSDTEDFVTYTRNIELHNIQCMNAFKVAKENYALEVAVEKYRSVFDSLKK